MSASHASLAIARFLRKLVRQGKKLTPAQQRAYDQLEAESPAGGAPANNGTAPAASSRGGASAAPAALRAASANQEEETPAAESDGAYDYS